MHIICRVSVLMRGSLFSSGGIVGSVYFMLSGVKCKMTCISLKDVLYGVSFVVHSSSGIVRMVIVFWFSFAARHAQWMAFCMFSWLCGWAYPASIHLWEKAVPLDPNMEPLWNGE
jgi:hypothetical protein